VEQSAREIEISLYKSSSAEQSAERFFHYNSTQQYIYKLVLNISFKILLLVVWYFGEYKLIEKSPPYEVHHEPAVLS